MDIEDLEPKKKAKAYELGQDLTKLSVGELKALIENSQSGDRARRDALDFEAILEERCGIDLQALAPAPFVNGDRYW